MIAQLPPCRFLNQDC